MNTSVLIVGGGLAGLTLARRLDLTGIDFQLVEGRDRFGGRILSARDDHRPSLDGFDLGPSWFWPESQPGLTKLVAELSLKTFRQYGDGDVVLHRMSRETPQRYRGLQQTVSSMRFAGGAGALIEALVGHLPAARLHPSSPVTRVERLNGGMSVTVDHADGVSTIRTDHIVFALPPRLVDARIALTPEAGTTDRGLWRSTPTRMAPHAKFFAIRPAVLA